jgi:hypothetical protein
MSNFYTFIYEKKKKEPELQPLYAEIEIPQQKEVVKNNEDEDSSVIIIQM